MKLKRIFLAYSSFPFCYLEEEEVVKRGGEGSCEGERGFYVWSCGGGIEGEIGGWKKEW